MKTITYEDFKRFNPCWLANYEERKEHAEQLARYRKMRDEWSALDILRLDEVSAEDRLWLVLREELIDAPIMHEFACRCAERALSGVKNPDKRSIAAIEAKRKWMRGECSYEELVAASDAARDAARYAERYAASDAASDAARYAARYAARDAARDAASDAARDAEREWQVAELMRMLEKGAQE